ncbi:uncharacterized protein [Labrus bergylta]
MTPVLVLLISAALNSASSSENSTGKNFILAFPENIAYYFPGSTTNKIQITALLNGTKVSVTSQVVNCTKDLSAGDTEELRYDSKVELNKSEISQNILKITSNENLSVHAISLKHTSMQTALIIPEDKLGTKYFIPPIPTIQGTTDQVNEAVTERQSFKIIIINAGQTNTVTVGGKLSKTMKLQPYEVGQMYMNDSYRTVSAEYPMAVGFGHSCAIRHNCTCGLLYTMLPPAQEEKLKFYIPPALAEDAQAETFVLLADGESTKVEKYNPDKPMVEYAGSAILYRPGLLLSLIPEQDFAACFLINTVDGAKIFATIVVNEDHTDGVRIGTSPLTGPAWTPLEKNYVSVKVLLETNKNVIWHTSSKMAVYFVGSKDGTPFGNPAPVISKFPDFRGCTVTPEVVHIGPADGWRESLQYCKDQQLELISFPDAADHQKQIYEKINQIRDDSLKRVWIGMRRSSLTGEWYWLNKQPVSKTDWANGEPGSAQDGQCAIMRADGSEDFGWSDEECCSDARPVCLGPPTLFPTG